ncbi:tRNA 2-selenouridine(34) synthase MnmH [Rhodoferax sp. BAB1]|uniref:tRNA 2-selenouridine(34) synthase MnmH n=1 Tax=Rhodoferax sp. BAB1 TaxID=2741720 RepID=UPI001576DC5D|nr:tRNA 2-selenouridine(34) synthase MnmH [Rhodoferax sp. BAB1]QKO21930.1 tRNA 2-selenouridine(34) synthase MnmH [Rhodoferax sp. BAB1]
MPLFTISAEEALRQFDTFDTVIDARSENEYAEDHLPGAVNWPTLDNQQRHDIGTLYKQVNAFEAKKRGGALAARNIAAHIEREVIDKPKDWKPLTYCWRGGKRSGSLSLILSEIGFRVTIIEGGYKAFRAALLLDIPRLAPLFDWRVVCGTTGSGKTRLLQALQAAGAQVLDLEALANHRSSVLGAIPGVAQPTQKEFDTRIWDALRRFDPKRPVYVESESKKVGNVAVPAALIEAMRAGPCLNLQLPDEERVALLLEDYDFFVQNREAFCERLDALTELKGKQVVEGWKTKVRSGHIDDVVRDLLLTHYDPVYLQSMARNFKQFGSAQDIQPRDRSVPAMQALAAQMLQGAA